jgi:hypothetical protein
MADDDAPLPADLAWFLHAAELAPTRPDQPEREGSEVRPVSAVAPAVSGWTVCAAAHLKESAMASIATASALRRRRPCSARLRIFSGNRAPCSADFRDLVNAYRCGERR